MVGMIVVCVLSNLSYVARQRGGSGSFVGPAQTTLVVKLLKQAENRKKSKEEQLFMCRGNGSSHSDLSVRFLEICICSSYAACSTY
jgi:hypothetical protein